jgi:alginate O-acetyltransferase complex protein AlgI
LGGNRKGSRRTYLNLFIVFLTTGFWHGASWNFIVWGLWHGLFIILEKKIKPREASSKIQIILTHIYTILVFVVGWVFFRADTLKTAGSYLSVMFGIKKVIGMPFTLEYYLNFKVLLVLVLCILFSVPFWKKITFIAINEKFKIGLENFSLVVLLILSIVYISASTYNPFIYFRF